MMRVLKYCSILLLLSFQSCTPFPKTFVRSDIFANPDKINNIYIMPMNIEISAEEANSKPVVDIRENFNQYYSKIAAEIRLNLIERGYNVSGVSPSIKELLSKNADNTKLIKELMKALRRDHKADYKFVYQKKDTEITITQKNPLLDVKTQPYFSVPPGTDALLLVMIKTHIAKRNLFGSLSEKSTFSVTLELFDFKKAELAFKDVYEETNSDIFKFSGARETINRAFSKLPIKT